MARGKGFDEAKALSTAMQLFWEKGYSATSLQDLEEATGLLRTSIYNAFGNKRSLFKACFSLYIKRIEMALAETFEAAVTSRGAIAGWHARVIGILTDPQTPAGCLVVFSVFEGEQHDQETKEMAASLFARERQVLTTALEEGVVRGEFARNLDCAAMAGAISATTWGLVVLAAGGSSAEHLLGISRTTLGLLG